MRAEFVGFVFLSLMAYFYINAVDRKREEVGMLIRPTLQLLDRNALEIRELRLSVDGVKASQASIGSKVDEILDRLSKAGIK